MDVLLLTVMTSYQVLKYCKNVRSKRFLFLLYDVAEVDTFYSYSLLV